MKLFQYPQAFAEEVFGRIERALRRRVADDEANAAAPIGRLFVLPADELEADPNASSTPLGLVVTPS